VFSQSVQPFIFYPRIFLFVVATRALDVFNSFLLASPPPHRSCFFFFTGLGPGPPGKQVFLPCPGDFFPDRPGSWPGVFFLYEMFFLSQVDSFVCCWYFWCFVGTGRGIFGLGHFSVLLFFGELCKVHVLRFSPKTGLVPTCWLGPLFLFLVAPRLLLFTRKKGSSLSTAVGLMVPQSRPRPVSGKTIFPPHFPFSLVPFSCFSLRKLGPGVNRYQLFFRVYFPQRGHASNPFSFRRPS